MRKPISNAAAEISITRWQVRDLSAEYLATGDHRIGQQLRAAERHLATLEGTDDDA